MYKHCFLDRHQDVRASLDFNVLTSRSISCVSNTTLSLLSTCKECLSRFARAPDSICLLSFLVCSKVHFGLFVTCVRISVYSSLPLLNQTFDVIRFCCFVPPYPYVYLAISVRDSKSQSHHHLSYFHPVPNFDTKHRQWACRLFFPVCENVI